MLADPVVARVLGDLERAIREGLPGTHLEPRRSNLSLATRPGDDGWTATALAALTAIGATTALAALGLEHREARVSEA